MATSISEYTDAIRSKPLADYEWWKHHVVFFATLFVFLPTLLTLYYGLSDLWGYLGIYDLLFYPATAATYVVFATLLVTIVGAFPGYYYDARYLRENDLGYSPRWKLYMAVHVVPPVGPFFAIPMYVIQRYRHAGLPMNRLY